MNKDISNAPAGSGGDDLESRLWEYIDGLCPATEKTVIEQLIRTESVWKEKYQALLEVHQLLHSSGLDVPSLRFTKNVMEEIAKHQISPAAKTYIDKRVIWGIAIFFFTLIAGLLIYGFGQVNWTSTDGRIDKYVDLDKIDVSRFFNNTYMNVFLMINVILGLMLFDRYLADKRKKISKEA
jgi:hypothetical protein